MGTSDERRDVGGQRRRADLRAEKGKHTQYFTGAIASLSMNTIQ